MRSGKIANRNADGTAGAYTYSPEGGTSRTSSANGNKGSRNKEVATPQLQSQLQCLG
jgi:hypothetical protein